MKNVLITLGVAAALYGLFYTLPSLIRHKQLRPFLQARTLLEEGSALGGIADRLRQQGKLPIALNDFMAVYTNMFSITWTVSTNQASEIVFAKKGGWAWNMRPLDASVRLGTWEWHERSDVVQAIQQLDFSKPISDSFFRQNLSTGGPDLQALATAIWRGCHEYGHELRGSQAIRQ